MPSHPHPWRAFAVVGTAIFLTILDLFIVNIAMPAVAAEFPATPLADLSWTLTIYAIVFGAALVPAGKLGDLYGRRRLFLGGLVIFLLGSVMAAAAPTPGLLFGGRAVQAIGAAAITPNSLAVLLPAFPPQRRPSVIAAWGALAGLGAAAGPPLGGILGDLDWRLIFLINIPIGLAALIAAPRLVTEVRDHTVTRLPDLLSAALLAIGMAALTLGFSQAPRWHWDGRFVASLAVAAVAAVVVWLRSRRHPVPILEPELLRRPSFRVTLAASVFSWAGFSALLVASSLFLTNAWGYSILAAGLAMTPGPALSAVTASLSGRLAARFGSGLVGATGGVLLTLGGVWMATGLTQQPAYWQVFLPAQLLAGAGMGLLPPTLIAITVGGLPPARLSTGIAVYSIFRQIGVVTGVAVWLALLGTRSLTDAAAFRSGWILLAVLSTLTAASMIVVRRLSSRDDQPVSPDQPQPVTV
jgi:EmrB/QacA subfamily drug resistance transporter